MNYRAREIIPIGLGTMLTMLPVTMVVPVLKQLVQDRFEVGDLATSFFMSANMVGAILAAPLAGSLSDWLGRRKPLILAALVIDALLLGTLAFAPNYTILMTLRFFEGAAHIFALSLMFALAADMARRGGGGRIMGVVGATMTFGVAFGAPLGGYLGKIDILLPLLAGSGLALVATVIIMMTLKERPITTHTESFSAALSLLVRHRSLLIPYAYSFIDRFTVGFFTTSFPLYLRNIHGRDPAEIGLLLAMFLFPFALFCYPFGRLAERTSRTLLLGGSSLIYGFGVCIVGIVSTDILPFLMFGLGVIAAAMLVPSLMLTGELASSEWKATAMGGFNAAGSLGFIIGPIVAGSITQWVGDHYTPASGYGTAFIVAGLSEVACVLLTLTALLRIDREIGRWSQSAKRKAQNA